ncbi:TPA: hypothetical protein PVK16_003641 [Acinetobacter baumannii]|nr:hypothetical protein [Acinetobacter baumannii]HDR2203202.1 hypothetical protein [Acinetobacter baumannii]
MQDLLQLWPESLLFERKTLNDIPEESLREIIDKIYTGGLFPNRLTNVTAILCLLYDARKIDPQKFLNDIYLPWIYLKSRTTPFWQRILKEISRHRDFDKYSQEDILHQINIYRNIVSELFDPLVTLLYASYKFIDGEIFNLFEVDLHAGERQKYEYVNSRLKCDELFSGYDPDVRNATSHTGGNGITIKENKVEFKSISRGNPPKIKVITWSYKELFTHTLELVEFVNSIEVSSEIFGLDSLDLISSEFNTLNQMIYYALSDEKQAEIIKNTDIYLDKIRSDIDLEISTKIKILSSLMTKACNDRKISVPNYGFNIKDTALILEIKEENSCPTNDSEIIQIAAHLTRYAIIGRSIFGTLANLFVVRKIYSNDSYIAAQLKAPIVDKYISKEAGLVDLLNDGDFFENGNYINLTVDFDALEIIEQQRLGKPLPRLQR